METMRRILVALLAVAVAALAGPLPARVWACSMDPGSVHAEPCCPDAKPERARTAPEGLPALAAPPCCAARQADPAPPSGAAAWQTAPATSLAPPAPVATLPALSELAGLALPPDAQTVASGLDPPPPPSTAPAFLRFRSIRL
jgi:hypothetical protein